MTSADLLCHAAADHLAGGDPDAARDAGRAGLRVNPDHPGLHAAVGLAEYDLENFGPAVHHLEAASLFGPLGAEEQLALADCYRRFGLVESAAAIYAFLAEPDRCPTPLLPAVAKGLGRLGRDAAALRVCVRLTRLRPGYHPGWYGAAVYRLRLGRSPVDALPALQAAHRLAPDALPYRLALAGVYADLGRAADAYPLVRAVPPAAVGCPCLCRRLAAVFATAGDDAGAAAYRHRADQSSQDTLTGWEVGDV